MEQERWMANNKNPYSDYFDHNRTVVGVPSLFSGFLFTSITILLNWLARAYAWFKT